MARAAASLGNSRCLPVLASLPPRMLAGAGSLFFQLPPFSFFRYLTPVAFRFKIVRSSWCITAESE
jgi:hypothetical protein